MNGWLKLHRRMKDHPVWQLSDGQFKVWIACLILANTKERTWDNKTDIVIIKPGSFVTSLEHLSKDSRTSIKTVRLALKALERIGSIRAQIRAQRYTLIELVNWPTWNGSELDEGTEEGISGAQQGHSKGTAGALTEEGKKERRKRKIPEPTPRALPESAPWPSPLALFLKYNREATDNCPAITSVSPGRVKKAQEYLAMFPDEDWWTRTFRQYHRSRFLNGTEERTNGHKGFQPDFDWLLSKGKTDGIENCVKVHDGRYADA